DQDFKNLMHVYLDAVFYPNIYREQNIFRQEGWHYEAEDADGEITVNGVVYNEMKGALASPEDILGREINAALYPHTPYVHESGGDPVYIPDLTYEAYLEFHRRYYHPSNSYIYLYGDMDMAERLSWIDEAYLSRFDRLEIDSTIPVEPAFSGPVEARSAYSILPEENPEGRSFLSWNVAVLPDSLDAGRNMAMKILNYALCDSEGAPVRRALREKGLGEDVYSVFEPGIRQPSYSVIAKYADPERKDEYVRTIRETLTKIAEEGIDRRALKAGINLYEFRYREADFGAYPKGLVYGLNALDTWLYDDAKPFVALQIGEYFDVLRKEAENGYFEKMIRECLLGNPHCAIVVLEPEQGLSDRRDEETRLRLQAFARQCTRAEREAIVQDLADLRAWQKTPDSEEDLRKIPMLRREDLTRKASLPLNRVQEMNVREAAEGPSGRKADSAAGDGAGRALKITALTHPLSTSRIDYLTFVFDISGFPEKYIRHLGIFKTLFSVLDTGARDYTALGHEINISTGGISAVIGGYSWFGDPDGRGGAAKPGTGCPQGYRLTFEVTVKTLHRNLREALSLVREILMTTNYRMPARILEVLEEERAGMRAGLASAGHATAAQRALSYISYPGYVMDRISGVEAYRTLDETCAGLADPEACAARAQELSALLEEMAGAIFRADNLLFDCTATEEDIPEILEEARAFAESLHAPADAAKPQEPAFAAVPEKKNEGLTTAGQIQFVCRAGRFDSQNGEMTGFFRVLRVLLGYDYMWNRIRVEGGAYGCMSSFTREGYGYMVSYRDPHLGRTLRVFEETADYLRGFDADEHTMTKYIIGAVSALDHPMTPYVYGRYSLGIYLTGVSDEMLQKERDQVLDATPADIRSLAKCLDEVMAEDCLCVVGSDAKIRENSGLFYEIRKLV
ncbi:MAG: insulinase family protein, partial [Eubacteriales bacterium]|nr:insulinase family protein [Eubacteriales bacterium]